MKNVHTRNWLRSSTAPTGPQNLRKEQKTVHLLKQNEINSVLKIARKVGISVGTVQNVNAGTT